MSCVGTAIGAPLEGDRRSEEHTSELQSLRHLVCRLLLETKNGRATPPPCARRCGWTVSSRGRSPAPTARLFPYTTLFRSLPSRRRGALRPAPGVPAC